MHTLAEAFIQYAGSDPDAAAVTFGSSALTRSELKGLVLQRIHTFVTQGVQPGSSVLLSLPTSIEFVASFWALQVLGAAAVPTVAIGSGERQPAGLQQVKKVCSIVNPSAIIAVAGEVDALKLAMPSIPVLSTIDFETLSNTGELPQFNVTPESLGIIQFTSGSTSDPKGCALSHAAIMANAFMLKKSLDLQSGDRSVCWLPLHHDMGLMCGVIGPVVADAETHLQSAVRFLANPMSWIDTISEGGRTHTACPNFALSLVLRRLQRKMRSTPDLSKLQSIVCGAEIIDAELVKQFIAALEPFGLNPKAFRPSYGMAEVTVFASSETDGLVTARIPTGLEVGSSILKDSSAKSVDTSVDIEARTIEVVSVGKTINGCLSRIVDDSGKALPENSMGHIQLSSPSRMQGYLNNADATAEAFDGEWLITGDIGFKSEDCLFIVGREKDLIIIGGQNIHPTDVESYICNELNLERRRLAVDRRRDELGSDEIFIVVESRPLDNAEALTASIKQHCYLSCGFFPAKIYLVKPGFIPRTTSGKIQRNVLRQKVSEPFETVTSDTPLASNAEIMTEAEASAV